MALHFWCERTTHRSTYFNASQPGSRQLAFRGSQRPHLPPWMHLQSLKSFTFANLSGNLPTETEMPQRRLGQAAPRAHPELISGALWVLGRRLSATSRPLPEVATTAHGSGFHGNQVSTLQPGRPKSHTASSQPGMQTRGQAARGQALGGAGSVPGESLGCIKITRHL